MKGRVLVTGADGFLGAAIASSLATAGMTVIRMSRRFEGADVVPCDVRDEAAVRRAV